MHKPIQYPLLTALFGVVQGLACITRPPAVESPGTSATVAASPRLAEKMTELDAWTAARLMSPGFNIRNDLSAFIGELRVADKKAPAERARWMSAVANAAATRRMVPVLWDTGHDVSRSEPHQPSAELLQMLRGLAAQ